mmetsp:Transcript_12032/g.33838  ORF Transcript_12032/g.33838 Transcript_12032/m.33838 type:complete len:219 (+) Transcript_12032:234-890(+)|eukprot:CAMPEP_0117674204 /NCGR_PEP_ID=MMETSP0804-20121206/14903_1 /TAXON_ID=1074897 /ORGANISM="Tetraselmis astigmatica, Strain CCMP880" /LENGTH=218 /DNA_ID=CAMNT_0005483037 /DNA_START=132 /DNA_END=788 /DNA_ORIENTATION=+
MDQQAMVQAAIEQQVLNVAKQMEDQLDSQMQKMENLGEDDLEAIRRKRIDDMKRMQAKKQQWIANGHGEYREILGEKEFFKEMKGVERMVCHFYRDNWPCKVMDKHLQTLAKGHVETKFVKINAEKSPFLVEKLKIFMLPTLALVKKEKVEEYIVGFDPFGGTDDFPTSLVAQHLEAYGLLYPDETRPPPSAAATKQASIRKGGPQRTESDEDSDFDD